MLGSTTAVVLAGGLVEEQHGRLVACSSTGRVGARRNSFLVSPWIVFMQNTSCRRLRVLHTADLHLGWEQALAEPPRATTLDVLERVVAAACDELVRLVIFAGDLFDSNRVSDHTLRRALALLAKLQVPIVILPGNHDCYTEDCVYRRFDWRRALPQAYVIKSGSGELLRFPALDLAVWGKAHTSYDDCSPLAGLPERGAERWQIAAAHGHLVRSRYDLIHSYRIHPSEIAGTERDYVALGHWDEMVDASAGAVTAAYSGSPAHTGEVLVLELDGDVNYRRKPI